MGWAIALHGGAGEIPLDLPPELSEPRKAYLKHCIEIGVTALKAGRSSLDVVELVVRELENSFLFNAGRSACLTTEGTVEMEASIMEGNTQNCGAVCGLKTVVNPISLARLVMEKTHHTFLGFEGAEAFAREQGVQTAEPSQFITPLAIEKLTKAKEANKMLLKQTEAQQETYKANGDNQVGTVGCVAVDVNGNMAAATSTGGAPNKMVGRIGDTPIIGAGTYANSICAVSTTGRGEIIIRGSIARELAAVMEYRGLPLADAAAYVLKKGAPEGGVGLIAVSATGEVTMPFNFMGMYRACATEEGFFDLGIH